MIAWSLHLTWFLSLFFSVWIAHFLKHCAVSSSISTSKIRRTHALINRAATSCGLVLFWSHLDRADCQHFVIRWTTTYYIRTRDLWRYQLSLHHTEHYCWYVTYNITYASSLTISAHPTPLDQQCSRSFPSGIPYRTVICIRGCRCHPTHT